MQTLKKKWEKWGICGLVASQREEGWFQVERRDAPCSAWRPQAHTRARTARWQGAGPRSRAQLGWVFGAQQLPANSWTSLGPPRVLSTSGFNKGCTQQKGEARACLSSPGPIAPKGQQGMLLPPASAPPLWQHRPHTSRGGEEEIPR